MTDNRAPAGAQERGFDARVHLSGIFDRLERLVPGERAELFYRLESRWCWHCGSEQSDDAAHANCPAPQPQGDRAALVERLRRRAEAMEAHGVFDAAYTIRLLREAADVIASTARPPSPSGLEDQIRALLDLDAKGALAPHGIGGLARTLLERSLAAVSAPAEATERPAQGEAREPDAWLLEAQFDHGWIPGRPYGDREAAERVAAEWAHRTVRVVPLYRRAERAEPVGARGRRLDPTLDCLCTTVRNPNRDSLAHREPNPRCPVHGAPAAQQGEG